MMQLRRVVVPVLCLLSIAVSGCVLVKPEQESAVSRQQETTLPLLGFTIQVGAFKNLDNAVRLMHVLGRRGIDAYYYRHKSGLYKVRFGDFKSKKGARMTAIGLRNGKVIDSYYIVEPDDYAAAQLRQYSDRALRERLVGTAQTFLGIPYKWGGESAKDGFDCSGLTMTVYKMNGLKLPRNSRSQYRAGRLISEHQLRPGDLVFFATNGGSRVTHVGLYTGDGKFIHAPKKGKTIRIAALGNGYFQKHFVGARTYLTRSNEKSPGS